MKRVALSLLVLVTALATGGAEATGPDEIDARRNRVNTAAMITLGSWALANIGTGTVLSLTSDGSVKYFHEMNAIWNSVNLGLAGLGLAASLRATPSADLFGSIDAQYGIEKTLLLNAGLDVAYMATGLYLTELSRRGGPQADRLQGYGQSLLLQGGFLFGFDVVVYLIQRRSRPLIRAALPAGAGQP